MNIKTPRLLFTIIGFGALTLGLSSAGEPPRQASGPGPSGDQATSNRLAGQVHGNQARDHGEQTDGKRSNSKNDSHPPEQSSQAGPTRKALPTNRQGQDRPKQATNSRQEPSGQRVDKTQSKRPSATALHQPGLNQTAAAAKDGVAMNPIGTHREQLARLPVGSGTTPPSHSVVRGQSAAAASIGGPAPSSAKYSAAVINGTGMGRRP